MTSPLFKYGILGEENYDKLTDYLDETWVQKFFEWIYSKRKRKSEVRIDYYDIWGMDSTLSIIIAPMLRLLQKKKHGSPSVDDDDVPDELKSINAPPKENEWDTDDNWHKRWDYVLAEMIWAFEQEEKQTLDLCDWESQYYTGVTDIAWKKLEDGSGHSEMIKGPKDTHEFDVEGYAKHSERMKNGFRLFGVYYSSLWD